MMKLNDQALSILHRAGVVAMIIGAIDPLEGSVVILGGSFLLMLSAWLRKDRQRKAFLTLFLSVLAGVFFLFFFSSLGGFGGSSSLSWWWGLLILPYPIGWLTTLILILIRAVQRRKRTRQATDG